MLPQTYKELSKLNSKKVNYQNKKWGKNSNLTTEGTQMANVDMKVFNTTCHWGVAHYNNEVYSTPIRRTEIQKSDTTKAGKDVKYTNSRLLLVILKSGIATLQHSFDVSHNAKHIII